METSFAQEKINKQAGLEWPALGQNQIAFPVCSTHTVSLDEGEFWDSLTWWLLKLQFTSNQWHLLFLLVLSLLDQLYWVQRFWFSKCRYQSLTFISHMFSFYIFFSSSYRILISYILFTLTFPSGYFYPPSYCFIIFHFLFIISLPSFGFRFSY